jgi:hypothetical protein
MTHNVKEIANGVSGGHVAFSDYAERHAAWLYKRNAHWRKLVASAHGRNWLTTFVTIWWKQWLKEKRT